MRELGIRVKDLLIVLLCPLTPSLIMAQKPGSRRVEFSAKIHRMS
jgi:hypothetical protein